MEIDDKIKDAHRLADIYFVRVTDSGELLTCNIKDATVILPLYKGVWEQEDAYKTYELPATAYVKEEHLEGLMGVCSLALLGITVATDEDDYDWTESVPREILMRTVEYLKEREG